MNDTFPASFLPFSLLSFVFSHFVSNLAEPWKHPGFSEKSQGGNLHKNAVQMRRCGNYPVMIRSPKSQSRDSRMHWGVLCKQSPWHVWRSLRTYKRADLRVDHNIHESATFVAGWPRQ
jgi:hypothetical protein